MSNRLFSATGAVWHCGPKRVKRTWGSTLVGVIMLLGLAALAGWLIYLLRHGTDISHSVTSGGMLLAVVPWQESAVIGCIGALMVLSVVIIGLAVRKTRQNELDAAAEQELRWSVAEPGAVLLLPPDDLRRILWSVTERVCTASDNVRKAQRDLSVEDYGEKLAAAEKDLRLVIKCLGDVMKHLNAAAAEGGQKA